MSIDRLSRFARQFANEAQKLRAEHQHLNKDDPAYQESMKQGLADRLTEIVRDFQVLDVGSLNDEVARRTQWQPIGASGPGLHTFKRLLVLPLGQQRVIMPNSFSKAAFVLIVIVITTWFSNQQGMELAALSIVTLAVAAWLLGPLLLVNKKVFPRWNKEKGWFWIGKQQNPAELPEDRRCRLDEIHALQLLQVYEMQITEGLSFNYVNASKMRYNQHRQAPFVELNLVLEDGRRVQAVITPHGRHLSRLASKLAGELNVKLWDASDKEVAESND